MQGFHMEGATLPPLWTPDLVEERLVEAWGFLRRMPGGGRSPFATDGPWSQIRKEWGDYIDRDELRERGARERGGLRAAEVDRMTEALDWVRHAVSSDVRLLGLVLAAKDREGTPEWSSIARASGLQTRFGRPLGPDAARMRFERALSKIARTLNALARQAKTLSTGAICAA